MIAALLGAQIADTAVTARRMMLKRRVFMFVSGAAILRIRASRHSLRVIIGHWYERSSIHLWV